MAGLKRYGKNSWKVTCLNLAVRLVILCVIGGGAFFGYKKFEPFITEKVEAVKEKLSSLKKDKGKDGEEGENQEQGEEGQEFGTGVAIRDLEPVYDWDFTRGMKERAAQTVCTPYGDSQLVEIGDPQAPVGRALYLDGDGDYIECGQEIQFSDDFTFNAVVNCLDVNKEFTAILGKYDSDDGPLVVSFRYGHLNCWVISDSYHGSFETEAELSPDQWYDVTVVYEKPMMSIYINGQLDGQEEVGQLNECDDLITIGRQAALYKSDYQYYGYIGKIRIYDTPMNGAEVAAMAEANLQPHEEEEPRIMTVSAKSLNVRSQADTSGDIVTTLEEGEEVEVLDEASEDWVKIRCIRQNDEEGYVAARYLAEPDQ